MRLMYVFRHREAKGYVCRVPEIFAWVVTRLVSELDYAETVEGY